MSDHGDPTDNRQSSSTPTSTTSGNLSIEFLPSSLAAEELQLALNKVSKVIYCKHIRQTYLTSIT